MYCIFHDSKLWSKKDTCIGLKTQVSAIVFCVPQHTFIARKSVVLFFGESGLEKANNSLNRVYNLGSYRAKKRVDYDFVRGRVYLDESGVSHLEEHLSKASRTLNPYATGG